MEIALKLKKLNLLKQLTEYKLLGVVLSKNYDINSSVEEMEIELQNIKQQKTNSIVIEKPELGLLLMLSSMALGSFVNKTKIKNNNTDDKKKFFLGFTEDKKNLNTSNDNIEQNIEINEENDKSNEESFIIPEKLII